MFCYRCICREACLSSLKVVDGGKVRREGARAYTAEKDTGEKRRVYRDESTWPRRRLGKRCHAIYTVPRQTFETPAAKPSHKKRQ
ncbi:hypothetical protein AVEN_44448-1 [Araneus ventricosus]|uniref:Uncharacterized protein n=1 Tax=Araneus ventricosus TaxID=182803 RepID=A0A4Y2W6Z6_ARAVE|nr:hypothetical protein AVEN_44448-1 [Araneus ventricosus]